MRDFRKGFPLLLLLAAGVACDSGRHAARGFRLPDGDIERGKVAFVSLGCTSCHEVSGVDLPHPAAKPLVPVVLGGHVDKEVTDGYLVTSIIYPSYRNAVATKPRMPSCADRMTVEQMTDVVAFLQSRYAGRQLPSRLVPY